MQLLQETGSLLILRFSKGEEFKKTFEVFLKERDIKGGFFYGLGGAISAKVQYYNLEQKEYRTKEFSGGHFEVTNITGNVAVTEGTYIIHTHATLADEKFAAFGGDVSELVVGGTLEILFTVLNPMERKLDEEVGLSTLS